MMTNMSLPIFQKRKYSYYVASQLALKTQTEAHIPNCAVYKISQHISEHISIRKCSIWNEAKLGTSKWNMMIKFQISSYSG